MMIGFWLLNFPMNKLSGILTTMCRDDLYFIAFLLQLWK